VDFETLRLPDGPCHGLVFKLEPRAGTDFRKKSCELTGPHENRIAAIESCVITHQGDA